MFRDFAVVVVVVGTHLQAMMLAMTTRKAVHMPGSYDYGADLLGSPSGHQSSAIMY